MSDVCIARFNSGVVRDAIKRELDELDGLYRRIGFPDRLVAGELARGDAETMVQAALVNPFRDNNRASPAKPICERSWRPREPRQASAANTRYTPRACHLDQGFRWQVAVRLALSL
jgi:hypothetical protein